MRTNNKIVIVSITLIVLSMLYYYSYKLLHTYQLDIVHENYFGICLHLKDEQHEDVIQWIDYHFGLFPKNR